MINIEKMIKYLTLIIFTCLLTLNLWASEFSEVTFKGTSFPNENIFSRKLKSDFDLIHKSWNFVDDKTIELKAIVFKKVDSKILQTDFQYEGENGYQFLNKNHVKYINYGVPLTFLTYGAFFWDWGKVGGFSFRDEGWFNKNTYAGGTDKLAHMYSHYLINRGSYALYRNSGLSHQEALKQSFYLATSIGVLIEIGDGISHYGFAVNDLIADMAGVSLGHLLNQNAYLDELIGFQMWWWSDDTASGKHKKGGRLKDPIDDYNNQKYVFNLRMAAIPHLRDFLPTRYLNFDVGYYSRGFKDRNNVNGRTERILFTGASLNLSQLLTDLFPRSEFAYGVSAVSRYYQVPYTSYNFIDWIDND